MAAPFSCLKYFFPFPMQTSREGDRKPEQKICWERAEMDYELLSPLHQKKFKMEII